MRGHDAYQEQRQDDADEEEDEREDETEDGPAADSDFASSCPQIALVLIPPPTHRKRGSENRTNIASARCARWCDRNEAHTLGPMFCPMRRMFRSGMRSSPASPSAASSNLTAHLCMLHSRYPGIHSQPVRTSGGAVHCRTGCKRPPLDPRTAAAGTLNSRSLNCTGRNRTS